MRLSWLNPSLVRVEFELCVGQIRAGTRIKPTKVLLFSDMRKAKVFLAPTRGIEGWWLQGG